MHAASRKSQWKTLRRHARAGHRESVHELLLEMLRETPNDKDVIDELKRFQSGETLRVLDTKKKKAARALQMAQIRLEDILRHRADPANMPPDELQKLHVQIQEHIATLRKSDISLPDGIEAYASQVSAACQVLYRKRRRRFFRNSLRHIKKLTIAVLIAASIIVAIGVLYHRAEKMTQHLAQAYHSADWAKTHTLAIAVDSGINRLLYPKLKKLLYDVNIWQTRVTAGDKELHALLDTYEKKQCIHLLSIEERANLMCRMRALPAPFSKKLLTRWEALCQPEKEQLDLQRNALIEEFSAELPPLQLTGQPTQDHARTKEKEITLRQLISRFQPAKEAFDLTPTLITPAEQKLAETSAYLRDIEQLIAVENALVHARSYKQLQLAIENLAPTCYPPALEVAATRHLLPESEETINEQIRAQRFDLPASIPEHVCRTFLDKGPTFGSAVPATQEQVHIMEDIFTSRSLSSKIYELTYENSTSYFSDSYPQITEKNHVIFTLSPLDPHFDIHKSTRIEWENAYLAVIRTIDPTPILRTTGMRRDQFFLKANVIDLLGQLTCIHDKDCPALAKAYAYHTLLELISRLHARPELSGIRFSPTLQEDAASFYRFYTEQQYPLSATCWLQHGEAAQAAESAYRRWFEEHADRDYAGEISRNFSRLLRTRTRFVGYVDRTLTPRYNEVLPPQTTLWYYSADKLISSPAGKSLENPVPFSPIFAE